jgi:hypothetical protein
MVRDRLMVSSEKMMLMKSSFQKTNVPEQLELPCLKIKKTGSYILNLIKIYYVKIFPLSFSVILISFQNHLFTAPSKV